MRFFTLALSILIAFASPAFAQIAIDAAGAEKVKKIVEETIRSYEGVQKATGQGVKVGGDVIVVPKTDAYEITLPNVVIEATNGKIDLGTVLVKATPQDGNSYYTTTTLPSLLTLIGADGKPAAEIKFGRQALSGLWRVDLGTFTKANAEYGDISVEGKIPEKPMHLSAGSLAVSLDMNEEADKTFSGVQKISASSFKMDIPATTAAPRSTLLTVASISNDTNYNKMNLAKSQEIKKQLRALYDGGKTPKPEEIRAVLAKSPTSDFSLVDGMTQTAAVSGIVLDVSADPKSPDKKPLHVTLSDLKTNSSLTGARQELGSSAFKLDFTGLGVTGISDQAAGLVPSTGRIDTTLDRLPVAALLKAITDFSTAALENAGDASEEAAQKSDARTDATVKEIMSSFAKAGTTLSFQNTELTARDLITRLIGQIKAGAPVDTVSQVSLNGALTLSFEGIDELALKLQEQMKTDKNATSTAQALTVLQMSGQPAKAAASGKSQREYKLEFLPGGKFALNGLDLTAVADMIKGANGQKP